MATWGEILQELQTSPRLPNGNPDWDGVRRKYLTALSVRTGRNTIVYYTDFLKNPSPITSITLQDMQGMMEVCRDLDGPSLDILLHSPGGSPEATASIVRYLRRKFTDIRVIVPLAAMSAATMWALSANRILMGKHSQLGPIDPQMVTAQGVMPARAIIEQFETAKQECAANPALLGAWLPILQQYGPALLKQCEMAETLSRQLVQEWLRDYMFKRRRNRETLASAAADYFADAARHKSHSLGIDREQARRLHVVVDDLEADQEVQDAVLSVHHATMHTLDGPTVKIIENQLGRAFVQMQMVQTVQIPMSLPSLQPPSRLAGSV
jgi:hypothetical protein